MTPPYKRDGTTDHDARPHSLRLEGQFGYGNDWVVYRHGFIEDVAVPVPVGDWKAAGRTPAPPSSLGSGSDGSGVWRGRSGVGVCSRG